MSKGPWNNEDLVNWSWSPRHLIAGKDDLRFTERTREEGRTVLTDVSHKEKTHEAAWCIIPSVLRVPVRVCMERWLLYEPGCGGRDREDDRYTLDAFKYISLLDVASRDPCDKVSAISSGEILYVSLLTSYLRVVQRRRDTSRANRIVYNKLNRLEIYVERNRSSGLCNCSKGFSRMSSFDENLYQLRLRYPSPRLCSWNLALVHFARNETTSRGSVVGPANGQGWGSYSHVSLKVRFLERRVRERMLSKRFDVEQLPNPVNTAYRPHEASSNRSKKPSRGWSGSPGGMNFRLRCGWARLASRSACNIL